MWGCWILAALLISFHIAEPQSKGHPTLSWSIMDIKTSLCNLTSYFSIPASVMHFAIYEQQMKEINQSNHQCSRFPRLQKGFYTNANKIMSLCRWWRPSPLIIIQICLFFFSLSLNYHMHNSLKGPNTSSVMISCHVKIFHCHSRDERERCELVSINHTWTWNWGLVFIFFYVSRPFSS